MATTVQEAGMPPDLEGFDWATTPLGPVDSWPPELRFAADLCRHSSLPSAVYWGPERIVVHNEAWQRLVGGRRMLGQRAHEALPSLWAIIGAEVARVAATGEGAFLREHPLVVVRDGEQQEGWWNCNLVPLFDSDGRVAGILNEANDVTKTVTAEARLSFQIAVADRLRGLSDPEAIKAAATELLGRYLGAARVGYAEIDEDEGVAVVRGDWVGDPRTVSLGGQKAPVRSFGEQALAYLRGGEVLVVPDIRTLELKSEVLEAWEAVGVRSLITVPLVREGALKALLYVHEPHPRGWKRSDAAMARDLAERTWASVERAVAAQSLRASEDHYRHTVELNPQVTWTARPDGRVNRMAARWESWTGTNGLGEEWIEALHPEDRQPTLEAWSRSLAEGEPYDVEHRIRMRDGGYRWARSRARPRTAADGTILLWYGSTEDVHERRMAEDHQRLLINELNHRVKNTLASVQGIAFQTLKGDLPLAEARARFDARLMALSRAHTLLTEGNWNGAALDRIVSDAVAHLAEDRARFDLEGEPLLLRPRAALALAMALHELSTNALKYGALSGERGGVAIRWGAEDEKLRIEWKESGGPPVRPPERRGFGTRLIERGLEADFGGTARLIFEPDGLRCSIETDLAAVAAEEDG